VPDAHEQLMAMKGWEIGRFAALVAALQEVTESGGTC
jgi:hypothetical protein